MSLLNNMNITVAGPWIDVKAHGAKGDGTTDDTAAIQEAINLAILNGGLVIFPGGQYKTSSTLLVNPSASELLGVHLVFFLGAVIVPTSGLGTTPALELRSVNNNEGTVTRIIVDGLRLEGTNTSNATGILIDSLGTDGGRVGLNDCEVFRFGGATGVGIEITNALQVYFDRVYAGRSSTNLVINGAALQGDPTTLGFSNCQFREAGILGGGTPGTGNFGIGAVINQATACNFHNCLFEGNRAEGMVVAPGANQNCVLISVTGSSWFEDNWHGGSTSNFHCRVDGSASGSTAEITLDHTMFNGGCAAISLTKAVNVLLDAPRIKNVAQQIVVNGTGTTGWIRNWPWNNVTLTTVLQNGSPTTFLTLDGPQSYLPHMDPATGIVTMQSLNANAGITSAQPSGVSSSIASGTWIDFDGASIGASPNAGLSWNAGLSLLTSQQSMGIGTGSTDYVKITGGSVGGVVDVSGGTLNIGPSGATAINIGTGSANTFALGSLIAGAAAANSIRLSGGSTGNYPQLVAIGSDPNVGLIFNTKGSGGYSFDTATVGGPAVTFNQLGSPTFNGAVLTVGSGYPVQATLQGNTTGNPAVLQAIGTDSSININLEPKGGGGVVATSYIEAQGLIENDTGVFQASGVNNVPITLIGSQNDGGGAVGVVLDNSQSLTTVGSKCVSIRNHGVEKRAIDRNGRDSVYGAVATAGNGMPAIVSYVELLGNTTDGASLTSFSPAADAVVEISGYINCTAYVSGNVSIQLSYTDIHSVTQGIGDMGGQSTAGIFQAHLSGTGSLAIFPMLIKVKGGSTVTLIARTGAGADTADFIGVIKQIA